MQGDHLPETLAEISRLLRNHHTGEMAAIDPALQDLLHGVCGRLGAARAFELLFGSPSPASNHLLRDTTSRVASRSLHVEGRTIDVRLPGIVLADPQRAALLLLGGVGFCFAFNLVHLDAGRASAWVG